MNHEKFIELLYKLDFALNADGSIPSVSPALSALGGASPHPGLYLTPQMSVENLTKNELVLAHTLLHKFYSTGNKTFTKEQLKNLHDKIKTRITHSSFDSLDD